MQTTDIHWTKFDESHVWHPYSSINHPLAPYPVVSAEGVRITLANNRQLVDGMSSWWSTIHGYNHPEMNDALKQQVDQFAHVMFGGLTHQPAAQLAHKLIEITPSGLETVFFSDSGSVSIEVALKMVIQYWYAKKLPDKKYFLTIRHGYHGDTFGAMSVCDPVNGMHSLFENTLIKQFFVKAPTCKFGGSCHQEDVDSLRQILISDSDRIGALILEPIVQGAGGMRFYSADYLRQVRQLCDDFNILLVADEIATGFGRTGKMFACEHAQITPDIMCVGKALTGGYLSLAATLATSSIAQTISEHAPGVFMHGPTFMANPMACTAANTSIQLLLDSPWQQNVESISARLETGLAQCRAMRHVNDVRVLGAIGVVELELPVDMQSVQPCLVEQGVWIRPFGKLIYLMPAYLISDDDIDTLTSAIIHVVSQLRVRASDNLLIIPD